MKWRLIGGALLLFLGAAVWWGTAQRAVPPPVPVTEVKFGFIRGIDAAARTIEFDDARWLVGSDAEDAAIAAGLCTEETRDDCIPNDYFILNEATTTERLQFSIDPHIAMMTLNAEESGVQETRVSLDEFVKLLHDTKAAWSDLPYQILLENGVITIVEEVYVPRTHHATFFSVRQATLAPSYRTWGIMPHVNNSNC